MSGGEEMKVKTGHLVMWVQGLVLVLLCARLGAGAILEKGRGDGNGGRGSRTADKCSKKRRREGRF